MLSIDDLDLNEIFDGLLFANRNIKRQIDVRALVEKSRKKVHKKKVIVRKTTIQRRFRSKAFWRKVARTAKATRIKNKKQKEKLERQAKKEYNKINNKNVSNNTPYLNMNNPYDFGRRPNTRHAEPRDITNAAQEHAALYNNSAEIYAQREYSQEEYPIDDRQQDGAYAQQQDQMQDLQPVISGEIDLFDKRLFPAQNSKRYSEKSGREFLADFTKATRGQLVVCMSRLSQENPREFARLWVEMEKFNTPQQAAVDINANVNARAGLYAKLEAMSSPTDMPAEILDTTADDPASDDQAVTPYNEHDLSTNDHDTSIDDPVSKSNEHDLSSCESPEETPEETTHGSKA